MATEELAPVSQQMGLQQVPQQQELLHAVVLQVQQFEMVVRTVWKQVPQQVPQQAVALRGRQHVVVL